ncbi:MAG: TonB-dependent receptor [Caulobacter sp.]|nr:TonB-dependent receptor [Caulobacter sp.]
MKRTTRNAAWTSVLLGTTMLAGLAPAFAQDAAGGNAVDEVIITAQKREENLQDVPVSIQALGEQKLDALQVGDFGDFAAFLPSVSTTPNGPGFGSVYMRGVASGGDGNHSGSLPSVGIYLDEQPITTIQGALDIHIYDIARVEALAGPQGTLYGASSQAGTIRIITNKPEIGVFEGAVDVETNIVAHGDEGYSAEGYVNIPISDRIAARLVGWYVHDAGYIDNIAATRTYPTAGITINNDRFVEENYNDVDTIGARMALKIDLNDDWTLTPQLMGQRQESNGNFAFNPAVDDLAQTRFRPEGAEDQWYQAALTVEGKLAMFDVVYAGSYLKRDVETESDYSDYSFFYDSLYAYTWVDDNNNVIDPTQYINATDGYERQTHELRIASPSDQRLRFVAGVFYQNQVHDILQQYKIDGLGSQISITGREDTLWLTAQQREDTDSAIFGEISFDIVPSVTVTGGLRAFKAENSLKGFFGFAAGYSSNGEAACFGPPITPKAPCTNVNKSTEEDGYTHRLNLTWKIDDDRMVYGTWSTGYRPGGINRRATLPPYQSDFLTNYEAGWKTSWMEGSLRWNGAVFLEEWEDFQFSILGANGLTEIKNAANAEIYGVETDLVWRITPDWTLSGGAAYTHTELTDNYCGVTDAQGNPITDCPSILAPDPPQAPSGTELPVTPQFKGNLTLRRDFVLADMDGYMQASWVGQTSSYSDLRLAERDILGKSQSWQTFDFSVGLSPGDWSLQVYVKNLFDERANLSRFTQCAEAVCGGAVYVTANKPRTIGLKIGRTF